MKKISRKREILVVSVIAGLALMLGLNLFLLFDDSDILRRNQDAPDFELPIFESEEILALSDLRGQIVLVDFWATWCAPCRVQMPALEAVAEPGAVAILSVNTDEENPERSELIRTFFEEEGLTIPTVLDDGRARRLYQVGQIPTLVVIDREGRIRHRSAGVHDEDSLRRLIERAR